MDGTDDYIDVSGVYDFSISNAVTVECWAQSDLPTWNEYGHLVSRRDQFIIHPQSGSTAVYFYVNAGGNWHSTIVSSITNINEWHYYTLTYDGIDLKAYVDGNFIPGHPNTVKYTYTLSSMSNLASRFLHCGQMASTLRCVDGASSPKMKAAGVS